MIFLRWMQYRFFVPSNPVPFNKRLKSLSVDLDQRNRPNQLHVVKYERVSRVLTVCFGSGRCVRHCNVPSYEFDSFRWSFMPDSYYSVRVGGARRGIGVDLVGCD